MALEKIELTNYQGHEKSVIKFSPGVTVLTGSTDSGKSSIIRALGAVCFNNLAGESEIRNMTEMFNVKLFVDGHTIERERGKENLYRLDGKDLKAFRSDVPDDVSVLLNMDEGNMQGQDDPYFLLSDSAPEVGRKLNAVVNLEQMSETMQTVEQRRKTVNKEIETDNFKINQFIAQISELDWIEICELEIDEYERFFTIWNRNRETIESIGQMIDEIITIDKEMGTYENLDIQLELIAVLEDLFVEKQVVDNQLGTLDDLVEEYLSLPDDENNYEGILADIEVLNNLITDREKIHEVLYNCQSIIKSYQEFGEMIIDLEKERFELQTELDDELEVCPLCGRSE